MKIRPSIRLYFLIAMLVTGVGSISVMTVSAVNYFFSGMDIAMTGFLRSQAMEIPLGENNTPRQLDELTIAAHWEDLPQVIQDNIDRNELVPNQLLKKVDGIPVLSPPKFGYFAMKVEDSGKVRYVSISLKHIDDNGDLFHEEVPPFMYIVLTGIGAIVVFAAVLLLVQKKIATPVEQLRGWAKDLDKEQLTQPVPNFHYSELNSLAELIQSSLRSVQESLEREQRFLGYASHELRTPIAVTRTNSELLRKMIMKGISSEKQLAVLDRIERAGFTMTDLTETLLWLNRQEGKSLPSKTVCVGELTKQVESELHYLLQGKSVEVDVSIDETELVLPEGLCRIIITNLIRNAFQHTQNGEVEINQTVSKLSITNRNSDTHTKQDDLGFGLGLELTQRLIAQYGWYYQVSQGAEGWKVEVDFVQIS
ncbi:sensor histidine kinase [Vibrio maerlii]|uniref:sensor histidine kinase n=1 Tax=Vibrio maerlii TaxID=2231648 RepID=UPI000E3CE11D|nr:HAMP domain-containing sensor histidine kinase [Vibrio maerlii]